MQIYYFFIKRGNKKYIRRIYGYLRITNANIQSECKFDTTAYFGGVKFCNGGVNL